MSVARAAFGSRTSSNPQFASDYTTNKSAKTSNCRANLCTPNHSVATQNQLLRLRRANALSYYACTPARINPSNLGINLLTTLDLTNIPVLQTIEPPHTSPIALDSTDPPPFTYTIDPDGYLFGDTPCGLSNWRRFLRWGQ